MGLRLGLVLVATIVAMLSDVRAEAPGAADRTDVRAERASPRPARPQREPAVEPSPPVEPGARRRFTPPSEPPAPIQLEGPLVRGWGGFTGGLEPHVRRSLERMRWTHRVRTSDVPPGPRPPGREGDAAAHGGRSGPPPTDAADADALPTRLALGPVTPNPGSGTVLLRLDLPAPATVSLAVLDVSGRSVSQRVEAMAAGRHRLSWSSRDPGGGRLRPGVYFLRVSVDGRALGTRRWAVIP
jgi:hypothetical protein